MYCFKWKSLGLLPLFIFIFTLGLQAQSVGRVELQPKGNLLGSPSLIHENDFKIYGSYSTLSGEERHRNPTSFKNHIKAKITGSGYQLGADIPRGDSDDYFSLGVTTTESESKYDYPNRSIDFGRDRKIQTETRMGALEYVFFPLDFIMLGAGFRDNYFHSKDTDQPAGSSLTFKNKLTHSYQTYEFRGIFTIKESFKLGIQLSPAVSVENDYSDTSEEARAGTGTSVQLGAGYFNPSFAIALDFSLEAENEDAWVAENSETSLSGEYMWQGLTFLGENGISQWSVFASLNWGKEAKVDKTDFINFPSTSASYNIGTSIFTFKSTVISLELSKSTIKYDDLRPNDQFVTIGIDDARIEKQTTFGQAITVTGNF